MRFLKSISILEAAIGLLVFIGFSVVTYQNYDKFQKKAIESEVVFGLKELYHAQKLYFEERGVYAKVGELLYLTKRAVISQDYFDYYDIEEPNIYRFKIGAKGKDASLVSNDNWYINEKEELIKEND